MKFLFRGAVIILVLAMIASLFAGCGGGGGKETTTIVIGALNDLTGPGSPTMSLLHKGMEDIVRYWNDNGLVPGVKLKLEVYDTILDSARTTIGYEFLKEKGAKCIITVAAWDATMLKAAAERDKIAVYSLTGTTEMLDPPGWVVCASPPPAALVPAEFEWIASNDWDYGKGIPKVAFMGQDSAGDRDLEASIRTYCQAHPDKYQYAGNCLLPLNTQSFLSEAQKFKDCDYICVYGGAAPGVMRDVSAKGGHPTYLDATGSLPGMMAWVTSVVSWSHLDGKVLSGMSSVDWADDYPQVDLAKQTLQEYRGLTSGQMGQTYLSMFQIGWPLLEIIKNVVDKVGAENVSGQAILDEALEYKIDLESSYWEGFSQWGYSQTKRYLEDSFKLYRWSAAVKGVVVASDWIPIEQET